MVVLVLAAGAIAFLQSQAESSVEEQGLRPAAEMLAGRLADAVVQRTSVASSFIQNERFVSLIRREDQGALRQEGADLRALMPSLVEVHFLPLEADEKDGGSSLLLSFAALAQVKAVEKSGVVSSAEVHQYGSKKQSIAFAVPIRESGDAPLAGVAHLAFSFHVIGRVFDDIDSLDGMLSVLQGSGENSLVLQQTGDTEKESADGSVAVAGTIWRVAYWNMPPASGPTLLFMAVLLVVALLVGMILYFLSAKLSRALKSDEATITGLLNTMGEARAGRLPNPKLAEFQSVFKLLARAKPVSATVAAASKTAATAKKPPTDVVGYELEIDSSLVTDSAMVETAPVAGGSLPRGIFLTFDIRGVVGDTLTTNVAFELGRAIGSEAYDRGEQEVIVGWDGRDSGPTLSEALCRGLMDSGRDVVRVGMVPTPLLYFATHFLGSNTGVMITGSHNPPEYSGLKIVIGGETLEGESIQALRERVESGNLLQGSGMDQDQEIIRDYIARVTEDVQLARPLKVVVDSGNGVAGVVAPELLRALGCEVVELFSEVDGSFPNHRPDPSQPENLQALVGMVQERNADIGLAFDGDGDRLGVVDSNGKVIWPDRLLMLLAKDVLARQPGSDVIFDVKSTRHLATEVLAYGGRPIMSKTGHSLIKAKMKETGALLAGEMSGHIFFRERWYGFDDALYSCARLLEILSTEPLSSAEVFSELPESVSTPELHLELPREKCMELLVGLAKERPFPDAKLVTMDGVRAEFRDGWGLARASNTTPVMVFRFEGDNPDVLERIQGMFRERMLALDPSLSLPF
ncbi:hypothetical protein BOW51_02350 [Solemya velesiana gill symbiont]|uniref:phosphomannomutase n=1 Tax=Solemya velesiana gill symbiont TaxID=1918948 RepID=A0A1T2KXC7_9GAMM|nr:hypothetical protein BOW51_02350 [Solemya velesiana gill symbiont]